MKYIPLIALLLFATSCNWFKQKTKDTINKSGEIVGKAGSEFAEGAAKGVEKSFENTVGISDELKKQGLKTGKVTINGSDSATDNILTVYLIFDNDIERNITAKVFSDGKEYGRATQQVKGRKNDAHYVDFIFDKRTNIDGKDAVSFE